MVRDAHLPTQAKTRRQRAALGPASPLVRAVSRGAVNQHKQRR